MCKPVASITAIAAPSNEQKVTSQVDSIPEYLKDLYEKSIDGLSQEQASTVEFLLKSYSDVFSKGPDDIGRAKGTQHKINTGDPQPIRPLSRLQDDFQ